MQVCPEALNDIAQNIHVVSERIGVEGGHVAAASKIMNPDHHGTNEELSALPFPLFQPTDSSHNDVGAKTPRVI